MKRVALIAVPLVGMVVMLGLAVLLVRTRTFGFRARPKAARDPLAITIDTVTEAVGETVE